MPFGKKFKNVIFDLGGVLIDLDESKTIKGFGQDISAFYKNTMKSDFVDTAHKFERGEISSEQFRNSVCKIFKFEMEPEIFDKHWNSMILGMPTHRIRMLIELRETHKIYVLSNTNEIHYNYFSKQDYWEPSLFDKVYFSHQMGMRKPEPEIFKHVLRENKLIPEETFYVDDNGDNIEAAYKLGIFATQVSGEIELLFRKLFGINLPPLI